MTSHPGPEPSRGGGARGPEPPRAGRGAPGPATGWELADAIYLAAWRDHREREAQPPEPAPETGGRDTNAGEPPGSGEDGSAAPEGPAALREPPPAPHDSEAPPAPGTDTPVNGAFPALSHRQELYRALRPFRLRVPDARGHGYDVEETARDYARNLLAARFASRGGRGRLPVPVLPRPAPLLRPGVHLTVLVDESVSMLFQQQMVRDFLGLLRSSGVFRSVRLRRFESDTATPSRVTVHGPDPAAVPPDRAGIHVAVVLSDGIGEGWETGSVQSWLGTVARHLPVAVVHLLDPRQWRRTGIRPTAMEMTVAAGVGRAPANRHYTARPFQWPEGLPLPESETRRAAVSIVLPVLAPRPDAIRSWAEFVMGEQARTLNAGALRVVPDDAAANATAPQRKTAPDTPDDMVRRFYRDSSEAAFRLAVDLAAVPLTEPAVAAVCQRFAGRPQVPELVEVLFSGLVHEVDSAVVTPARRLRWEYREGIRGALLSLGGRRSRIRRTLAALAAEFEDQDPWFSTLRRILDGHDEVEASGLDETSLRLAEDTLPALESLGLADPHRELVHRVREQALARRGSGPGGFRAADRSRQPVPVAETRRSRGVGGSSEHTARAPHPTDPPPILTGENSMMSQGPVPMSDNFVGGAGPRGIGPVRGASPAAVWGGDIPPRNALFTGRDDLLLRLRERLRSSTEQGWMTPSVLKGMPGIGKTQLATEYLYRFRDEYDLVWWVRAGQTSQINQAYTLLAQELGVFRSDTSINSTIHTVREALRRGNPRARWLLIFDDVRQPDDIKRYLPVDGDGHVIVTSRNLTWPEGGYYNTLTVDVFSLRESVALLRRCGLEDFTESEAAELAEELGHMPIALRQAAAWMNDSATSVAEYLASYRGKRAELLPMFAPADPDYPETVITALNVSLDRLAMTNPAALQLLQVCAFFSTAPIPRFLFRQVQNVEAPADLEDALRDPNKLNRAFSDIGRYGLALLNHRNRTFQLHRLTQRALRFPLSNEEQERLRHCAHLLLAKSDPQDTSSAGARARYAQLFPHVWETEAWDCTDPWARSLVIQEIYVTDLNGEHEDSKRIAEAALRVWREKLGENAPETLRAELRLVRALRNLGERQPAYELCERVLSTLIEQHGPDSEETLRAGTEFIRDLRYAGRFRESVELARDVRDRYRRLLGPDDPEALTAAHNYAYALLLAGHHREAAALFWEVYQSNEMILGPNSPATLAAVDGYADALMESGDYFRALRYQRENTERIRSLFGINHRGTLNNMAALAVMLRRTGNLDEAVDVSGTVWREASDRFGEESPIAVVAAANHAAALRSVNRYNEALDLVEKASRRYTELLGENHPHVAAVNVNRAVVLRQLGRVAEAREIDERALRVLVEQLGETHTSTLSCALNLASDFFALGNAAEALRRDSETLERCRDALSDQHPLTLLARRNLALNRMAADEDVAAELAAVERAYAEIMGDQHPATLSMRRRERGNADLFLSGL
ncbi:FxSxx-COOH system tetratricopeptide repeat protein [Thermobifida alba]|uniref:FxSxx-COOH system tetratricopeptide repeat protein n=1 Tax=Thermobifida alba TaxID=53522 RepID=UPI0024A75E6F|nr:FxSxx-COOH system tetratricopeptide repeat protein [Thermobifida alba]